MALFTRELDSQNLLDRFQDDWDRLFGWTRFPEAAGLFDRSAFPLIDVVETEEGVTIWAEVPGLDKKELDLSIAGNVLTLKGEKKAPAKADKDKDRNRLLRDETWSGSYHRSLSLPDSVDPEKVSAEFRDGILKITVAKKKEHKPRQIAVAVR
jgi:HSP20 family protein